MALIALVSSALSISTIIKQGHRNPFQKVKNYIQWMLAMIPVYSWCSVLALAISQSNIHWFEFFVMIREFFESLVILSFIQFLLHFMITLIEEERSEGLEARYHAFIIYHEPEAQCCGMVNWKRGPPFISRTIVGGLQFVVCAIVDVVLRLFAFVARFGLGHTDWSTYLLGAASFIRNASQSWALFCMFYFYMATVKRLHPINPELKFIAVKGVVFFTYWQGLALFIAEYFNALDPKYLFASENSFFKMEWENGEQVSSAINNMLIVIEMLGFAILHMVAFNPDEFATASREQQQAVIAEGATRDERDKMEETENLRDEIVHLQKRKSQTTMRPRPIVQLSQIPEGSEEGQEGEDERKEGEGLFGPKSGAQSSRGSGGGAAAAAASSSQGFTGGTSDPMPAPMHQPMPASPTGMGGLGEDQIEDALQNRVEALGVVMSEIAAGGEGGGEGGMAGAAGAGLNSNEGTVENSSEAASGEAIVEKAAAIVFDRQAQETKQANTNQKKMDAWNERFSSGFGLNDFFYAFFYCEPIPE
uniref:Uncharacterized protein n=1 Tax=Chromera velia CCMP2878 TaxID=1169474 RepID=A0A0G4G7Q1_9ALVE|eukprot:Cvel_4295.t1-p1 / transcript=Cvel_4295.t1 / gene=Cvel_4295 / organism=Chromera_velia_CCMP2878 / gene_product=Transmembrane protein 184C, putative / transcript_product=Transmembrane protein 184C, putative / location=Cvel_scaffold186:73453-76053(+) / protein_length=532 / sequence_SO=supercontig / SO=protein_coding / is_pseudo=false